MDEREEHFRQLRWSLQDLAASNQHSLFPEWATTADHLALDFEQAVSAVLERYGDELEPTQRTALDALRELLERMSRDHAEFDVDIWSVAALATSEQWAKVRRLAVESLSAFGWSEELPPADRTPIFVRE
jgi:hypothetical protein